jgi:phage shock protein A
MGIFRRIRRLFVSNANAALDYLEDVDKLVDMDVKKVRAKIQEVQNKTAEVMAEEKRLKGQLERLDNDINKLQKLAGKAVDAGNDGDAEVFLAEKLKQQQIRETVEIAHKAAMDSATRVRNMFTELTVRLGELESRGEMIKVNNIVASTQETVNKMEESIGGTINNLSSDDAFGELGKKVEKRLNVAMSKSELQGAADPVKEIKKKYTVSQSSEAVKAELEALKAKRNK